MSPGGRDRPEAACPSDWRRAAGEAGGFNAVQKLFTRGVKTGVETAARDGPTRCAPSSLAVLCQSLLDTVERIADEQNSVEADP